MLCDAVSENNFSFWWPLFSTNPFLFPFSAWSAKPKEIYGSPPRQPWIREPCRYVYFLLTCTAAELFNTSFMSNKSEAQGHSSNNKGIIVISGGEGEGAIRQTGAPDPLADPLEGKTVW